MQVFWLNGGIHIEPESVEERAAMGLLFDASRKTCHHDINEQARRESAGVSHDAMHGGIDKAKILPVDALSS